MIKHTRRDIAFAIGLSALEGYVDAIGFLSLGGFFVSFMSGNTTRLAVGITAHPTEAWTAARLIASFVVGVIAGSLIGKLANEHRRPAVLALVAGFLAVGAGLAVVGAQDIALLFVTAAMGSENATFERDGEVSIGVTYMTGTLVKLGQRLAAAFTGGAPFAWVPYALLWLGLLTGAIVGASLWPDIGLSGLWLAAAAALALAAVAIATNRRRAS